MLGGAAALCAPAWARAAEQPELRSKGTLQVAVYKHYAPFYYDDSGKGIDVDIGRALAKALSLEMSLIPFDADESVDDDLRNMVWKGHYLGHGPADVMMHVPVATSLMKQNEQAQIFAPYYREKLQVVRNTSKIPKLETLAGLKGHLVGTEDAGLGSVVLLGVEGGTLSDTVRHFKSAHEAIVELKAGRIAAVVGHRSELHSELAGVKGYEITDAVAPGVPPNGWVVGLSVKTAHGTLAKVLDKAMKDLLRSGKIREIFAAYNVAWVGP